MGNSEYIFKPIGYVKTSTIFIPRYWSYSDVEGEIIINLKPPHKEEKPTGVFNTCSPIRPNPIGLSVLDVLEVKDNIIKVKKIDMFDGTPIFDIKPYKAYSEITDKEEN